MLQLQQSQITGNSANLYGHMTSPSATSISSHDVLPGPVIPSMNQFVHRSGCFQGCSPTLPATGLPGCVSPPSFALEGQTVVGMQRTSPPLNYQSLHIIREDVCDASSDQIVVDDQHRWSNQSPKLSTEDSTDKSDFERFKQKFSKNPRISITDTQGHSIPMSSQHSADEETMITDDVITFVSSGNTSDALRNYDHHQRSECSMTLGEMSQSQSSDIKNNGTFEVLCSALPLTNFLSNTEKKQFLFDKSFPITDSSILEVYDHNASTYFQHLLNSNCSNYSSERGVQALNLNDSLLNEPNNDTKSLTCALTRHSVPYLLQELQRALERYSLEMTYRIADNHIIVQNETVLLQIEVCQGEPERTVKFLKIAGDNSQYNKICNELLACLAL